MKPYKDQLDVELYIQAKNMLLEQGAKAIEIETGKCRYFTNGNYCGAGLFLKDKVSNEVLAGLSGPILADQARRMFLAHGFSENQCVNALFRIQQIHDALSIKKWPEEFDKAIEESRIALMMSLPYAKWTDRELYTYCRDFLVRQGKQARDGLNGRCVYLSNIGHSCGAGLFLKGKMDDSLISCMKGSIQYNSEGLTKTFVSAGFNAEQVQRVLRPIQGIHDSYYPALWPVEFNRIIDGFPYSQWSDTEILIYARDELIKQNAKAMNNGQCVYLGTTGKRCGAGLFLKGRLTDGEISNTDGAVSKYATTQKFIAAGFTQGQCDEVLLKIQSIHDFNQVSDWKDKFDLIIAQTIVDRRMDRETEYKPMYGEEFQ
jgi:hypothetical protein